MHCMNGFVRVVSKVLAALVLCMATGCGGERGQQAQDAREPAPPPLTAAQVMAEPGLVHARLRAANPGYRDDALFALDPVAGLVGQINVPTVDDISGLQGIPFGALDLRGSAISDITPLRGMPLVMLGLEGTKVVDLSPLAGMRITTLYLNDTHVANLAPLKGLPIETLMLATTKVADVSPLAGMPLKMLWLNNTPVTDIAALKNCPLVSLTLEGTHVSDLSPLSTCSSLKRLHIAKTKVTTLFPLKGLQLERLIFTSASITEGLDVAREMESLKEIGSTLDRRMPPSRFWKLHGSK